MTKDEALQLAIEAIENFKNVKGRYNTQIACEKLYATLPILKEALEQPTQEPMEFGNEDKNDEWSEEIANSHPFKTKSYLEYDIARRMVSNRHSKGALVDLVCWLLQKQHHPKECKELPVDENLMKRIEELVENVDPYEWQGLSDEEVNNACNDSDKDFNVSAFKQGVNWAEQKLKEKNYG